MKFQLGMGRASWPPSWLRLCSKEENRKGVRKFSAGFLAFSNKISKVQKIVLSSSRGQGNFRGLEASRPRSRTSKCVLEDSTSGYNGYLPPVTVTSDVLGQFHVRLFFGLELALVMIRVGAKFRLWIWLNLPLKLTLTIPNLLWCSLCDVRCDCNR